MLFFNYKSKVIKFPFLILTRVFLFQTQSLFVWLCWKFAKYCLFYSSKYDIIYR